MFILTVRLRSLYFILISFLLITSCASLNMGYERYYAGEYKSLTDVSLVVTLTESMVPGTSSWIDKIDNQQAKKTIRMGITFPSVRELSPGMHTICTDFQTVNTVRGKSSTKCENLILEAKPGHVYLIYPKVKTNNRTWEPDYWDITGELHTPEMKDLVAGIDKAIAEYRVNTPLVSVLSLSTKQSDSPLVGFGEEYTSNLQKWLNKKIYASYKFNRYVPYIVVEADDNIEYHLEIDQKTGLVADVLGKNVAVEDGFGIPTAFQPLNSKFAYQQRWGRINTWEEQRNGSYIKVK
jgi:hypothetical protein